MTWLEIALAVALVIVFAHFRSELSACRSTRHMAEEKTRRLDARLRELGE